MLGERRKNGANASVEARPRTMVESEKSLRKNEDVNVMTGPAHHGKTSMMEFLHKKAIRKSN